MGAGYVYFCESARAVERAEMLAELMGDAAREAAGEREADARALRGFALVWFGQREQPFFGRLEPADGVRYFSWAHSYSTLTRALRRSHSSFDQGMAVL